MALVVGLLAVVAGCGSGGSHHSSSSTSSRTSTSSSTAAGPVSTNSGQAPPDRARRAPSIRTSCSCSPTTCRWTCSAYMPQVQALETRGLTFGNYFVSDSLCCPSRASIFTGDFPHDTGVFDNVGPRGGFDAFYARGEQDRSFNVALQRAGYRTALMGKYLNGYLESGQPAVRPHVRAAGMEPVGRGRVRLSRVRLSDERERPVHQFGHRPRDYLTDVIARKGIRFIDPRPRHAAVLPRAGHVRAPPALHAGPARPHDFPGLRHPGRRISTRSPPTRRGGWRATRRWTGTSCARSTGPSAAGRSRCRRSTR